MKISQGKYLFIYVLLFEDMRWQQQFSKFSPTRQAETAPGYATDSVNLIWYIFLNFAKPISTLIQECIEPI